MDPLVRIYPDKNKLNGIKIILILLHLRKQFRTKVFLYLIELPICNSAKCKMKFTGHWLRYSTTPDVTTFFTES